MSRKEKQKHSTSTARDQKKSEKSVKKPVKKEGQFFMGIIAAACVFLGGLALFSGITAGLIRFAPVLEKKISRGSGEYGPGEDLPVTGTQSLYESTQAMHDYYEGISTMKITSPGERILSGPFGVDRRILDRNAFLRVVGDARELGYDAKQIVAENQLPYQEYSTLLQIVEAEATGGDVKSKMLIANVVLNRVDDPRFPDTISEVVWQNVGGIPQFSPTADGRMGNLTITESTVQAVTRAIEGENIAKGALFFVARDSANDSNLKWFDDSLVFLYEYGGHAFYTFPDDKDAREHPRDQSREHSHGHSVSETEQ